MMQSLNIIYHLAERQGEYPAQFRDDLVNKMDPIQVEVSKLQSLMQMLLSRNFVFRRITGVRS